jgi:hypothetical protein
MVSYIKNKDRGRSCEIPVKSWGNGDIHIAKTLTCKVALQHRGKEGAGVELKYCRVDYSPLHFPLKGVRKQQ